MSLDALLQKGDDSFAWTTEKVRLKRLILGSVLVAASLGAAVFLLRPSQKKAEPAVTEKSLALLMQVQNEAKSLQNQVDGLRIRPARAGGADSNQPAPQVVRFDPGEGFAAVAPKMEASYIPTGAVFLARLVTPIKTSLERTFVMAEVTREFRMDLKRRIPKRSRLIGRSRLNPVLKGVVVEFETLVLPDGTETRLNALALSRDALPEIDGLYFSNSLENYGTALAFGFLSGFSGAGREREWTPLGSQPTINLANQVLGGLSTASFQVAEDILRDIRERAVEYVVVPAGEPIFVALTRRYELGTEGRE